MDDQIVHGACHATVQCLGESDLISRGCDEPLVNKLLPIFFHEIPDVAQSPVHEPAIIRDPTSVHYRRVERLGVAEEDVLNSSRNEQMSRPVGVWVLVQRDRCQRSRLDLGGQLLR